LKGLQGEADLNTDGAVSASELASFTSFRVPEASSPRERSEQQVPVAVYSGAANTSLTPNHYRRVIGVFIGISQYTGATLRFPAADAKAVHAFYQQRGLDNTSELELLTDAAATRARVVTAIERAAVQADSATLLVLYFAGHGHTNQRGGPVWTLHDTDTERPESALSLDEIKALLQQSKARTKVLYIDASFALPLP
jgi:hypothetical protein